LNNQLLYEILFDLDAPENVAHIGLIDVAQLKAGEPCNYNAHLTGLNDRLAGSNGRLTGDGASPPPAVLTNASTGF